MRKQRGRKGEEPSRREWLIKWLERVVGKFFNKGRGSKTTTNERERIRPIFPITREGAKEK